MIDLETVSTTPNACILTIAAQTFNPIGSGYLPQDYYARVISTVNQTVTLMMQLLNGGQHNHRKHKTKHSVKKAVFHLNKH